MSDEYKIIAGRVQFEPKTRQAGGKNVRGVTVKVIGPVQNLVTLTVWPEHEAEVINQGDFLFAEGKFTSRPSDDGTTTYYDLSVTDIAVVPAAAKANVQRSVVNRPAASTSAAPF